MKFIAIIASLVSMLSMVDHASAICHHNTDLFSRSELSARADSPAFGYNELSGALNWHGLSSNNSLCAVGKNQSPVSFQSSQATLRGQSLSFSPNNKPQGAEFLNLGTTVEVLADGSANIRNKRYNLKQFHFHTPSEHHLNGAYFPAEVHFVFQAAGKASQTKSSRLHR
jgi:carbonic anhydrase